MRNNPENRLQARTRRTRTVIAYFASRNTPHEFDMLRGLLCCTHGLLREDQRLVEDLFDSAMIAERMDQMNAQARERHQAEMARGQAACIDPVTGDCLF